MRISWDASRMKRGESWEKRDESREKQGDSRVKGNFFLNSEWFSGSTKWKKKYCDKNDIWKPIHHSIQLTWRAIIYQLKPPRLAQFALFPLQLRISEMEMNKARNLIEHEEEIFSRPPRVWFQSKADLKRKSGNSFKNSFNLRNTFWLRTGISVSIIYICCNVCVFVHR